MKTITPEEQARVNIDNLLEQSGWAVQDSAAVNLYASNGVAVREFSLKPGHGAADYLLYVNQKAIGVIEDPTTSHFVAAEDISETARMIWSHVLMETMDSYILLLRLKRMQTT